MDKIKNFFTKKKLDAKFKVAGQGHVLDHPPQQRPPVAQRVPQARSVSPQPPSDAKLRAAQAAHERFQHAGHSEKPSRSAQAIRLQAKKELDRERQASVEPMPSRQGPEEKTFDAAPILAVNGVYFTCELLPSSIVLPRDLMIEQVEQFLREQLEEEPLVSSSVMIHSLNTNRERRQEGIDVLSKYLDNLITQPEETKFRRIRMSNKVFAEKVLPLKGGVEFLEAIGFTEQEEAGEKFLVLSATGAEDISTLIQAKEMLMEGEPVPLKLYRDATVLAPSSRSLGDLGLPRDFFERTATEVKHEQKQRTEELEKMVSLRTKEMRERDELKRIYRYRYTLIRVRFPDGYMLQGTFATAERFSAVEEFVRDHLVVEWAPFVVKDPRGEPLRGVRTDAKTLGELGLAPASLLTFEWDDDIHAYAASAGVPAPEGYLKRELVDNASCM